MTHYMSLRQAPRQFLYANLIISCQAQFLGSYRMVLLTKQPLAKFVWLFGCGPKYVSWQPSAKTIEIVRGTVIRINKNLCQRECNRV